MFHRRLRVYRSRPSEYTGCSVYRYIEKLKSWNEGRVDFLAMLMQLSTRTSFHSFFHFFHFNHLLPLPQIFPTLATPRIRSRELVLAVRESEDDSRGRFFEADRGRKRWRKGNAPPCRVISLMVLNCDVLRSPPSRPPGSPRQRWSNSPLEIRKLNWYLRRCSF